MTLKLAVTRSQPAVPYGANLLFIAENRPYSTSESGHMLPLNLDFDFLGRLFNRVDLIKPQMFVHLSVRMYEVCTYVHTSVHKKFIGFQ